MYCAKVQGRNRYQLFSPDMATAGANKLELKMALSRALDNRELELLYQPIVNVKTGEVSGDYYQSNQHRFERYQLTADGLYEVPADH